MKQLQNIAVIDIGKTNAKVVLVDLKELFEIDYFSTPNIILNDEPFPHYDIKALWSFIRSTLSVMQTRYGVDAISVTTHGAGVILLDSFGQPILPILDYEHGGPDSLTEKYNRLRPDFSLSGTPRSPLGVILGAQIYWLLFTKPEISQRLNCLVTYPQYWVGLFTGNWCTEVSYLGCHTDLWLPWEKKFSSLVKRLGLTNKIAPIRKASDLIGPVLPSVSREIGLPKMTPVYCGIHDSNASLYRHLLAQSKPFSLLSTGTWVIIMAIGGKEKILDQRRDLLVNVNALGDPVPSARFMGGREFEILTKDISVTPTEHEISTVLDKLIMLSPSIIPQFGPFQNRSAKWSVPEVQLNQGERTVVASLYLAMMATTCLNIIGAEGPIITEGPFAKNVLFLDLISAATGSQVLLSKGSTTGTSIGVALLASPNVKKLKPLDIHPSPQGFYREKLIFYSKQWKLYVDRNR
ncbi:MAG: FGGY-family carbohydrate kinase [Paracoccaceae bacterium]|nr:FGGY-family carbohydrate kinase [Paracoccaceae bacterium]